MIRISLTTAQLATARFTVSPLLQLVSGLVLVRSGRAVPSWLRAGWCALSPAARETLEHVVDPVVHYIPDFVTPVPPGPSPGIDAELQAVRDTSLQRLRMQLPCYLRLGPVPPGYAAARGYSLAQAEAIRTEPTPAERRAWAGDPAAMTGPVADALAEAWATIMAPRWPRLRAVLETDVLHRTSRAAAAGMTRAVLEVVEAGDWDGTGAELASRARADVGDHDGALVLAPLALARDAGDGTVVIGPGRGEVMVGYPARGRGALGQPAARARPATATGDDSDLVVGPEAALSTLLPGTRGDVLHTVANPTAGHVVAARLGVSPATVSYHLDRLRRAGLVQSHRRGKEVLYVQTETARRLAGS